MIVCGMYPLDDNDNGSMHSILIIMWPIHIIITITIICITSIVTIYHSNAFNSANSSTHTPLHQSRSARKPPLLSVLDKTSSTISSIQQQQQQLSGGWNDNSNNNNNNSVLMSNSMNSGSSSSSSKNMRMMFDEDASKVLVLIICITL